MKSQILETPAAKPDPRISLLINTVVGVAVNSIFAFRQENSGDIEDYFFKGYWSICALFCFVGLCGAWNRSMQLVRIFVVYSWFLAVMNLFLITTTVPRLEEDASPGHIIDLWYCKSALYMGSFLSDESS
ncbi:hypothetical protein K493DRAFT_298353 [Basidiobolus meristosporus CBS 931.73]|uniref:Uncharacterized protein n=1 Tax=Basidiobolus meristosporus CBS 931.73 TaxID=1314790 RepID=A0A1Y1YTU2_9FUNG|nr:hypothetical protein K493DRAFT_298353 [Basidiobolus meristosporus CBS 931.73]|eukprot:ORY01458.1 hypothetical protein K493DRAFT_298353 [Basidiobolus meristosporus CBS 931.73]